MHEQVSFGPEDRSFVYAVARKIVGSADDADDVTQDALLVAYRHRDAFRGDSRYRTWLYRIAFTTALGYLRRRMRAREALAANDDGLGLQIPDPGPSQEAQLCTERQATHVRAAISTLSPFYRDVLLARAHATETEVAAQLGISLSNVKVRAHRARKQLQELLADAV
jgi:RNA polymerase sigma-70 factor (ECF subfamily)